jgi:hypothetical protein
MAKRKMTKEQTTICKTLHRKLKIATRTPLKTWVELMCSGRVGSSCSTSGTRSVTLVTNPVISHERGKDWVLLMTGFSTLQIKQIYMYVL